MSRSVSCAFLIALAILGCTGSPAGPNNNNGNNSGVSGSAKLLTATWNGTAWTATAPLGAWFNGNFSVSGHDGQGHSLIIAGVNVTGPGTYSLAQGNANNLLGQIVDSSTGQLSTGYANGTGTLALTVVSLTRLTGTFSFTAATAAGSAGPTIVITNGTFDLSNP